MFSESEDQTLEGDRVPKSADIVFVVSQKGCNTRAAEMIQKFVTTLETTFKTNGVRHNRYGLVGFGGTGVHAHAHSHTMDTQLFNNKPKFIEVSSLRPGIDHMWRIWWYLVLLQYTLKPLRTKSQQIIELISQKSQETHRYSPEELQV